MSNERLAEEVFVTAVRAWAAMIFIGIIAHQVNNLRLAFGYFVCFLIFAILRLMSLTLKGL